MPQKKKRIPNVIHIFNQMKSIKTHFPQFEATIKKDKLIVSGEIQPSPLHSLYKFNLVYKYGSSPNIYILEPKLRDRDDGEKIPHVYSGNKPCLYYPKNNEFSHEEMLSETIIPWLSLWLYFYEIWLITGEWLGEGIHNGETKNS